MCVLFCTKCDLPFEAATQDGTPALVLFSTSVLPGSLLACGSNASANARLILSSAATSRAAPYGGASQQLYNCLFWHRSL